MTDLKIKAGNPAIKFERMTPAHQPRIDCTDDNGKDSQHLQNFIERRAMKNQKAHLGMTYVILRSGKIIGYITLAASNINKDRISKEKRPSTRDGSIFPAIIILDFCIDKRLRGNSIGAYVLGWCHGLARDISEKIGCRYITLFTRDAVDFYDRHGYRTAEMEDEDDDFILMYADIFPDLVRS